MKIETITKDNIALIIVPFKQNGIDSLRLEKNIYTNNGCEREQITLTIDTLNKITKITKDPK